MSAPPAASRQPPQPRTRRGGIVSVACNACRHRRSKCDGGRPTCAACESRGSVCEYASLDAAETRTGLLRRKQAEAESQLHSYQRLFEALRHGEAVDALRVMTLVRSGASASEILRHIEGGDLKGQPVLALDGYLRYAFPYISSMPSALLANRRNPYLKSRILQGTIGPVPLANTSPAEDSAALHPSSLIPYHRATLLEPDLEHIHASPWTNVVRDDDLVRELVGLYLLQEYPFLTFFHKESFLYDMRNDQTEFCSPLLVNAILACAAHGMVDSVHRADFWSPHTWSYRFAAEARRLWDIESITPSLTNVQAGLILSVTFFMDGNDTIGSRYLSRAVEMAQEIKLLSSEDDHNLPKQERISRLVTAWSLYAWQATMAFHLQHAPLLEDYPNQPLPSDNESELLGELQVLYPLTNDPVKLHHAETFRALIHFRLILNDISSEAFSQSKDAPRLSLRQALAYRKKLELWVSGLPEALRAEHVVFPSQLKLHLHYHNVMLVLFKPFAATYQSPKSPKHPTAPSPFTDSLQSYDHPLDIVVQAKSCMETLVRLYYLRHGFEHWDSIMPQFISSVGFFAAEDLAASNDPETRREILSTVILCLKGLHDQGKSTYVSEVIYRLLRRTLTAEDERLLEKFADIEHQPEREKLMEQHVHSAWPIRNADITEDAEEDRIDNLVRQASRTTGLADGVEDNG